ncbi:MAG: DUF2284 domain-containing protein [Lachnospiraceae bacterium]|nr:DUF2284 domain-containing protein [Lachnospiraceae bacterium]
MESNMQSFAKKVDISDFVENCVDVEYFLDCCSKCPNFGKTWSCPPYDFNPLDYWNQFKTFLIIAKKIVTPPELLEKTYELSDIIRIGSELTREATLSYEDEIAALLEQFPESIKLGSGPCKVCGEDNCARKLNQPCRFPDKRVYSIESLGGNVEITLKRYFDEGIYWGKDGHLAPSYIKVGGILMK